MRLKDISNRVDFLHVYEYSWTINLLWYCGGVEQIIAIIQSDNAISQCSSVTAYLVEIYMYLVVISLFYQEYYFTQLIQVFTFKNEPGIVRYKLENYGHEQKPFDHNVGIVYADDGRVIKWTGEYIIYKRFKLKKWYC